MAESPKRRQLLEELNEALADRSTALERELQVEARHESALQQIRSEKGTAAAERRKAEERFDRARERLLALIPDAFGEGPSS